MSPDKTAADLLSAADPALTITEEELILSRQRSLSFMNSDVTQIAVGGSVDDFHRVPPKRHWGRFAAAGLAVAAVAACIVIVSNPGTSPDITAAAPTTAEATATATPAGTGTSSLAGPIVTDSFGNVDYYTTVAGETPAAVAASFGISEAKLAEFNGLDRRRSPAGGHEAASDPAPGPIVGAKGAAVVDASGIPISYVIEPNDTLDGSHTGSGSPANS